MMTIVRTEGETGGVTHRAESVRNRARIPQPAPVVAAWARMTMELVRK